MRKILGIKLKAQALHFALMVAVIVALLLGSFLMLTHTHSFFKIQSNELIHTSTENNRTILGEVAISSDTLKIEDNDKIIKKKATYHGAWEKVVVKTALRKFNFANVAFKGSLLKDDSPNLYVVDQWSPVVVAGNTRVEGNNYISKAGFRAGNIGGEYYQGSQLFYGRTYESKEALPQLEQDWKTYLDELLSIELNNTEEVDLEKEVKNTFLNTTKLIRSIQTIPITHQKLIGNIIIKSNKEIIIYPNAVLQDVICIAPKITVKSGFKGTAQLIASKNIKIEANVVLQYPSAVLMSSKETEEITNTNLQAKQDKNIEIDKGTSIDGSVVFLTKSQKAEEHTKTHIFIDKEVDIRGEIYCEGNIDFRGKIQGGLYANQFIAKQKGSIYMNHIIDAQILPYHVENYVGLPFKNTQKSLARWLY